MRKPARFRAVLVAAAALLLGGACNDLTVPDYNNPSIEDFENNPNAAGARAVATGLLAGARQNLSDRVGYVSLLGILGRESYTLDGSDPRYVSEMLQGPLTNSGAFGAGLWNLRYQNIRNANMLLNALPKIPDGDLSPAQKAGMTGFAKTMQALDFLLVINARDTNGAPIDVNRPLNAEPAPIVSKAEVFAHINTLLAEARTSLGTAGGSFAFPMSEGMADFDTPAEFLKLNWAIQARVRVYQGDYPGAVTALNASFVNAAADMDYGAYHSFSAGAGDQANQLTTNTIYAHPGLMPEAETQEGSAAKDRRALAKLTAVETRTAQGLTSSWAFTMYADPAASIPVIRNEELLLLRAEARWFTTDKPGAMADLNLVRAVSGGLAPIAQPATDADFVTALLRERRYSLLFEGGHRWIDHRRFGRLQQLPKDVANHVVHERFRIPEAECLARGGEANC